MGTNERHINYENVNERSEGNISFSDEKVRSHKRVIKIYCFWIKSNADVRDADLIIHDTTFTC